MYSASSIDSEKGENGMSGWGRGGVSFKPTLEMANSEVANIAAVYSRRKPQILLSGNSYSRSLDIGTMRRRKWRSPIRPTWYDRQQK